MTPRAMMDLFREHAHDTAEPFLWSDALMLARLNEGRLQAVRRARLIEDGDAPETCKIAVKADRALYDVDPRVIFIRRVKLTSQSLPLPKVSVPDADIAAPGWEDAASGTPRAWMPWGDFKLRLIDPPDTDDTLRLLVCREPIEPMTLAGDEDQVELPARYHDRLIDWMCARAYLDRDLIEKYRPDEARDRMAAFVEEFGPPSSALDEKWIHRHHGYDDFEGLR